ncbi:MAG: hypothetical protein ACUVTL_10890 [Thermoproteota archaeon]
MSEKEIGIIAILLIGAFFILLPILSIRFWAWRAPWHGMMGMAGYGWGFMLLVPILLVVLILVGAYLLLYDSKESGAQQSSKEG